jgi:hypothetical protein
MHIESIHATLFQPPLDSQRQGGTRRYRLPAGHVRGDRDLRVRLLVPAGAGILMFVCVC